MRAVVSLFKNVVMMINLEWKFETFSLIDTGQLTSYSCNEAIHFPITNF